MSATMSFHLRDGVMKEVATDEKSTCALDNRKKNQFTFILRHIDRHKVVYRIGTVTLTLLLGFGVGEAMAAGATSTGIDAGGELLYMKLVRIGKWVILIKGAFDAITATVQGDFISARKTALSYILLYVILLGLPWGFNQVETLFEGI